MRDHAKSIVRVFTLSTSATLAFGLVVASTASGCSVSSDDSDGASLDEAAQSTNASGSEDGGAVDLASECFSKTPDVTKEYYPEVTTSFPRTVTNPNATVRIHLFGTALRKDVQYSYLVRKPNSDNLPAWEMFRKVVPPQVRCSDHEAMVQLGKEFFTLPGFHQINYGNSLGQQGFYWFSVLPAMNLPKPILYADRPIEQRGDNIVHVQLRGENFDPRTRVFIQAANEQGGGVGPIVEGIFASDSSFRGNGGLDGPLLGGLAPAAFVRPLPSKTLRYRITLRNPGGGESNPITAIVKPFPAEPAAGSPPILSEISPPIVRVFDPSTTSRGVYAIGAGIDKSTRLILDGIDRGTWPWSEGPTTNTLSIDGVVFAHVPEYLGIGSHKVKLRNAGGDSSEIAFQIVRADPNSCDSYDVNSRSTKMYRSGDASGLITGSFVCNVCCPSIQDTAATSAIYAGLAPNGLQVVSYCKYPSNQTRIAVGNCVLR